MNINEALNYAARNGFEPSVYHRGTGWRVHLNVAGNIWEDVPTLHQAARWLERTVRANIGRVTRRVGA